MEDYFRFQILEKGLPYPSALCVSVSGGSWRSTTKLHEPKKMIHSEKNNREIVT